MSDQGAGGRRPVRVAHVVQSFGLAGLACLAGTGGLGPPRPLLAGSTLEHALRPGGADAYALRLSSGDALHVVAMQKGDDVELDLFDPAGGPLLRVDSPNDVRGPEDLFAVAATAGLYRLEVRCSAGTGTYRLSVDLRHRATPADGRRAEAVTALSEGDRLRRRNQSHDLEAAAERYRRADELSRGAADPEPGRLARFRLATVDHTLYRDAEALELLLPLNPAWSGRFEGDALLDLLGNVYKQLGELDLALAAYQRAAEQARRLNDARGHLVAIENEAELHHLRGEYRAALDLEESARQDTAKPGLKERGPSVLDSLAQIRLDLGDWQPAVEESLAAIQILHRQGDADPCELARARQLLATARLDLEQWDAAAGLFRRARDEVHGSCRSAFRVGTGNGLGFALLRLGRLAEAAEVLRAARREAQEADDRLGEGNALGNLGAVYGQQGDIAISLASFARARELYRGSPEAQASLLFGTAEALETAGRLDEASRVIGETLQRIETLRRRPAGSDLRSLFFATWQDEYELAIRVEMELEEKLPGRGHAAYAFDIAERTRARSSLDELAAPSLAAEGEPPLSPEAQRVRQALEERQRDLEQCLAAAEAMKGRPARGSPAGRADNDEIDSLASELAEVRGELRLPRGSRVDGAEPSPLGLEAIQREVLDPGTLLLAYSLGRRASFLWAVDQGSIEVYRLPARDGLERLAEETSKDLADGDSARGARKAATSLARLSRALLGPVAARLGDRRLVVVGDGALQYVPFEALTEPRTLPPSGAGDPDDPPPLLISHEIVYLPSISLLPQLRRRVAERQPPDKLVAALADGVFEADDARLAGGFAPRPSALLAGTMGKPALPAPAACVAEGDLVRSERDAGVERLDRLLSSRDEADAIVALAPPGQSLEATGFEATRDLVLSRELGRYRYIQLATHGFLDTAHPELSGLVFSRFDAAGHARPGFLYAYEIYDLKLAADLVVLSACQTARGREMRGEGLVGMTRGFMVAGVPRVVVSLWNINDQATASLMAELYRGMLRRQLTPAAALRAAQRAAWADKRWHSPYYWAAFELQGDWR